MLNTFIPAFMWAYHELNTIIKEDEGRIHNDQSEINAQKVFLNGQVIRSDVVELDELDTFPSDPEQRSREGTGAPSSEGWGVARVRQNCLEGWHTERGNGACCQLGGM